MRAEVIEVRVRDENIKPVEVPLIIRGVDDSGGVFAVIKHQQNFFVANQEAAVQQVINIHKFFSPPSTDSRFFCKPVALIFNAEKKFFIPPPP